MEMVEMEKRIDAIFEGISKFSDKITEFFEDELEGYQLSGALMACMKPTFHGTEFKERGLTRAFTKRFITDLLQREDYFEYDDDVYYYAEHVLKHQSFPEEAIAERLCRNAKEPPKCPWCGRYSGGTVNEIWVAPESNPAPGTNR